MSRGYKNQVETKISKFKPIISSSHVDYSFDESTEIQFISGEILFVDGSQLDFSERISVSKHRYRFHYMDKSKKLIIRWDNAPHHKNIKTFPSHKHVGRKIEESETMNLIDTLERVQDLVSSEQKSAE